MRVRRTGRDRCTRDTREPMSYQNDVTHWWDGSQIYGNDDVTSSKLRDFNHGKLKVAKDGWLPKDRTNIDITGEVFYGYLPIVSLLDIIKYCRKLIASKL